MAIAAGNTDSLAYGSRTNTTANKPTGVVSGHVMFAHLFVQNTPFASPVSVTAPSGWTLINTSLFTGNASPDNFINKQYVYWKLAGGSEPSTYTWTHTSAFTEIFIQDWTGVDTTTPADKAVVDNSSINDGVGSSGKTVTLDAGTTVTNGAQVVLYDTAWDAAGAGSYSGTTPTLTTAYTGTISKVASGNMATAGATGSRTRTNGNGSTPDDVGWVGTAYVIRPAVSGNLGTQAGTGAQTGLSGALGAESGTGVQTGRSGALGSQAGAGVQTGQAGSIGTASATGAQTGRAGSLGQASGTGAANGFSVAGSVGAASGTGAANGLSGAIGQQTGVGAQAGLTGSGSQGSQGGTGTQTGLSGARGVQSGVGAQAGVAAVNVFATGQASGQGTQTGLALSAGNTTGPIPKWGSPGAKHADFYDMLDAIKRPKKRRGRRSKMEELLDEPQPEDFEEEEELLAAIMSLV